jgi:2-oxoisovalerate dehydrogenase E1 component
MPPYRSQEELEEILSELWQRIFDDPEIVGAVAGTPLVAKFRYTDFPTALVIDIASQPPAFHWNPDPEPNVDVEMILSSETAHRFWMEDLNIPLAIAGRKIIPKGSVQKALKMIPALKPAFALYPGVLKDAGRPDLVAPKKRVVRKKRGFFSRRRRPATIALDALPQFPMAFDENDGEAATLFTRPFEPADDAALLRAMVRIRSFESHLSRAFADGRLPTEAIHLSIGQEAVAAGVCLNLTDTDYLNTTHRGHGHIIAKGADLDRMMAEIYGKADGLCDGKGGSMHVTDGDRGILGANGIVGAGYLLAMGAGLAIKMSGKKDVSVVIAGDGSVNQGMFHEAMNMMAVFQLPVLVVVENNLYGEFTPVERHSGVTEMFRRAEAYGIATHRFDGNDVRQVHTEVGKIVGEIRSDGRPRFVELMTYRWHGHMEGESEAYRTREEKETYMAADPIARLEKSLVAESKITLEEIDGIRQAADADISRAVERAEASALPPAEALMTQVYAPEDKGLYTGNLAEPHTLSTLPQMSVAQAINQAIAEEMQRDPTVFLWGEDVALGGYFSVTEGLVKQFGPDRVLDTPISENGIVGGAVGAAMTGMRPVAEILFSDFLTCCVDPLFNQAAKLRYMTGGQVSVPLTVRTPLGSGIGMAAQHSQSLEKCFVGIPGLMVAAPSDPYTAKGLLKSAIRSNNPVLFFEHKLLYAETGPVPEEDYTLPLGKARIVHAGSDVTVVSHLLGVRVALDAADILAAGGIEAEVIDLVTLYPLDSQTILDSVARTGHLVTVEEGVATAGIGAEVVARTATAGFGLLRAAPVRIAAPECPIPYAKNLETAMLPDPEQVAGAVRDMLG